MKKRMRRLLKWSVIDLIIIMFAYTGAYSTRALIVPLDYFNDIPYLLSEAVVTIFLLYSFGVYDRIWSQTSGHGVSIILLAVFAALLSSIVLNISLDPHPLPTSVIIIGNFLVAGLLVGVRYRGRLISGLSWRWRAIWYQDFPKIKEQVLIIGAGESGQTLAWRLKHRFNGENYAVAGFIDDDPEKQSMYVEGSPVLGTREDIIKVVDKHDIDLIVLAIHNLSGQDSREILTLCEQTKARIKVVPNMLSLLNAKRSGTLLRDVEAEDLLGRSVITRHEAIDLTPVTNKIVLVTGAAGSIGSELSRQLVSYNPIKLILLDNNESNLHDLSIELESKYPDVSFVPVLADITVEKYIREIFDTYRPQVIFHAAAYKHVPMLEYYPHEALRVNVQGTRRLVKLAHEYAAERFVFISTDKAVKPSSIMGASKRICELIIHAFCQRNPDTLYTVVRFGNVLSSRGSVVPTFNRQIAAGGPITVTHQNMTRYFMSISEAVNLVLHAACLTEGDDIFVLKMGEVVRILDIAERMIRLRGLRPYEDIPIEFTGIRPGEKMHEELYVDRENVSPTIHPYILQLNGWSVVMDSKAFFHRLDDLCCDGFVGNDLEDKLMSMVVTKDFTRVPITNSLNGAD